MVSFRHPDATGIAARTRIFSLAESLGGVESLIEVPQAMTHQSVEDSDAAVPADLVRLSCGDRGRRGPDRGPRAGAGLVGARPAQSSASAGAAGGRRRRGHPARARRAGSRAAAARRARGHRDAGRAGASARGESGGSGDRRTPAAPPRAGSRRGRPTRRGRAAAPTGIFRITIRKKIGRNPCTWPSSHIPARRDGPLSGECTRREPMSTASRCAPR